MQNSMVMISFPVLDWKDDISENAQHLKVYNE